MRASLGSEPQTPSDTGPTSTLTRAELVKLELVEQVLTLAQLRLPPGRRELALPFIEELYEHVPPADLVHSRPDNLYGAALSLLAFAEKRERGETKIRVYNPRLDEHGFKSSHTIVEIINDDMPFLVDSVIAELNRVEVNVRLVIHPILRVRRDSKGVLERVGPLDAGGDGRPESWMQIRLRAQSLEKHAALVRGISDVLSDVRSVVEDFAAMRERCQEIIHELDARPPPVPEDQRSTAKDLLRWVNDDHFTYLGYRSCSLETVDEDGRATLRPSSGLGILRDPKRRVFDVGRLPEPGEFLRILKANYRSTVHRRVHMDVIIVPQCKADGEKTGEHHFVGLFTLAAYSRSPDYIPLLREKIARVLARAGFPPDSHDGKTLKYILETYPRDELFQITESELLAITTGILHLQDRQRVALFVRHDPFERFVSCLVYVPRDRFDTQLRLRIQDILATAFTGSVAAYYTHLTDDALARLHVIIKTPHGVMPNVDLASVEHKLLEATRSWQDRLEETLVTEHGEEQGIRITREYANAFPAAYREDFDELTAVNDIDFIEESLRTGQLAMNLYRRAESKQHELFFKIYSAGRYVALSEILPMLENMGLRVIGEVPYEIVPSEQRAPVWIHDFAVETEGAVPVELSSVKEAFHEVFGRVIAREMENDGFNKLVLHAGLGPRDVKILRAYSMYLRQLHVPFSQAYMQQTLKHNAGVARLLVDYFRARFDPQSENSSLEERLLTRITEALDAVDSLDEDRILRKFANTIGATVRTNFYQKDDSGRPKPHVSFKIDCARVDEMPLPRPFREVFVFSPRVEGVHLRFGPVARGGLRWSDRLEDFRTEILGLVKAQQVKNAVIVPVGSKGGFVVKRPPPASEGRDALIAEGIECYKTFICGLLDITDNLVAGEVASPRDVRRHDPDDPYLVVAADKGTATFSDIANSVSRKYGFWLDDAFASGGSAGYDHKKIGITARGAWEAVKRHFRELGKNIQREDFTCAGVGDMSGDVFGNAMLLSRHTKLIAAFNHLHIFVDPDPDPESSYEERSRLFNLPRSTWRDYDTERLSAGGGVFDRSAKSIAMSAQMQRLLGVDAVSLTPSELIRAILKARVELLFFGGIGSYVKATGESNADVGDRANDNVRIEASECAARVIGEGANLALTQRARIEYSLGGGRCNTDFIDNSAGVDCSDHEVNIKILLGEIERSGDITRKQRDELLEQMTDDVAALVLRDNYLQTQALTVTHQLGAHLADRIARFMRAMEKRGALNRGIEALPDDDELADRLAQSTGFTRPELAVLLSYGKNALYEDLLGSELPADPYLEADLAAYFPLALRERFPQGIEQHRLKREIVATTVTNDVINRLGITFVHETRERTGMPPAQICLAYIAARDILKIAATWAEIEALDNQVSAAAQARMLLECGRVTDRLTVWLLREHGLSFVVKDLLSSYSDGVAKIIDELDDILPPADRQTIAEHAARYEGDDIPPDLAQRVASLPYVVPACDIVRIAARNERDVSDVARIYYEVGRRFGFEWLRRSAAQLPTDRAWDKQAISAIFDDLFGSQRELTQRMLECAKDELPAHVIETWAEPRRPLLQRNEQLLAELEASPTRDFAMLAVANRHLKALLTG